MVSARHYYGLEVRLHGEFACVVNANVTISGYTINPGTERPTVIAGLPFAEGGNPYSVTVDPSGKFVYARSEYQFLKRFGSRDG